MGTESSDISRLRETWRHGVTVTTSGSTESPKRVHLSGSALRASVDATESAIGAGNWVLALPLEFIAGIMVVVRADASGGQLVDVRSDGFDADRFLSATAGSGDGPWFTSLVPTQLGRVVDVAEQDERAATALRRFVRILVGGQAVSPDLIERARALGANVTRTYGAAETAGGVVYDGIPLEGTRIRIEDGRVLIASGSLADGYDGEPERTAAAFVTDDDGTRWWRTTDLGTVTEGVLSISGRADDIIVSGGIKVSLFDIERALEGDARHVVATWRADDEWGQVPVIVTDGDLDLAAARTAVADRVGKHARPAEVIRIAVIPTLPSGKPDRIAVRRIAAEAKA